jgi:hypothetical protein
VDVPCGPRIAQTAARAPNKATMAASPPAGPRPAPNPVGQAHPATAAGCPGPDAQATLVKSIQPAASAWSVTSEFQNPNSASMKAAMASKKSMIKATLRQRKRS